MAEHALQLFHGAVAVGSLAYDDTTDAFSLGYDPQWVKNPRAFPLSPHLPLSGGDTAPATVRRFVENLLPEGRALDVASRHANISKSNIFGLIRSLGRESAGALTFLPMGHPPEMHETRLREVSHAELQERIDARNEVPFSVWDGKLRMSVAGHQDKLLALLDDEKILLADGSLASTHILKPEPLGAGMPCMVANEHFCMRLASRISLRRFGQDHAAEVRILRVPAPVLAVKRFDRQRTLDGVKRFHIIDGCQVLDRPVSAKYERNMGSGEDVKHIRDGVSLPALFGVRGFLEQPALGVQRMVLWAVSTLLLGNSDAHGKNISFYSRKAGLRVCELYDLVSVVQYDARTYEHDLAMAFGDEFALAGIRSFALADFCERSGIARSYFARELSTLCKLAVEEAAAQAKDPVYQRDETPWVQGIADFVAERARLLLLMAPDIPRFKKDNF